MDPPVLTFQSVVVDHRVNFCLYVRLQNGKTERVPYSAVTLPSPSHISVGELAEMERACIERTLAGEPRVVNLRMKGDLPLDFPVIAYDQLVLRKN
ncbi:hypothetical protein HYV82_00145 [Candidatus Woesearchaeota archaeon]|nr:hypothetical protein [Candidatus Woesearchaeota archaeon]